MFKKLCKKCGAPIEGARNKQVCEDCKYKKPHRPAREFKHQIDLTSLQDREFRSYLLGFLFTDGSVRLNPKGEVQQVGWYSSDKEIVQKITDRLGYSRPLFVASTAGKGEWGNYVTGSYARAISAYGLTESKENHTLQGLDVDLYPFLRGHLDGDGTIDLRETSIGWVASTVTFLTRDRLGVDLKAALEKEGFPDVALYTREPIPPRTKRISSVMLGSTRAETLLRRMYENATIYLDRKKALWDRIKDTRKPK